MYKFSEYDKKEALGIVEYLMSNGFYDALGFESNHWGYKSSCLEDWREENMELLEDYGVTITRGETKICIIPDDTDYVIKVGLLLELKGGYRKGDDYCAIEYNNYKKACELGIEKYFASMCYLGVVNDISFYLQEKVRIDEDRTSDNFYSYSQRTYYNDVEVPDEDEDPNGYDEYWDNIYSTGDELDDEERIYAMIDDDRDAIKVSHFCMDNEINDLHGGNWGYVDNWGQAVLIDYSGF